MPSRVGGGAMPLRTLPLVEGLAPTYTLVTVMSETFLDCMLQVSQEEPLLMPSRVGGGVLPLRIMPLEAAAADPAGLTRLLERHRSACFAVQAVLSPGTLAAALIPGVGCAAAPCSGLVGALLLLV